MQEKIELLRKFFRISNAAFEFKDAVQAAVSQNITVPKMRMLHKLALDEIEKENPDLEKMDKLLEAMEEQAEINSQFKKNFNKGGIITPY